MIDLDVSCLHVCVYKCPNRARFNIGYLITTYAQVLTVVLLTSGGGGGGGASVSSCPPVLPEPSIRVT